MCTRGCRGTLGAGRWSGPNHMHDSAVGTKQPARWSALPSQKWAPSVRHSPCERGSLVEAEQLGALGSGTMTSVVSGPQPMANIAAQPAAPLGWELDA